jgi:hypothetical protein
MYAVLAADAIDIGSMCWFDKRTQTVKMFSHLDAWTGSTAGAQGKVAENFVGVATSAHVANDAGVTVVRIACKGAVDMLLSPSAIVEIGDVVTAAKDPAGNFLLANTVAKGSLGDPDEPTALARELAVGRVAIRSTVAISDVVFEYVGTREAGSPVRQGLSS